MGEKSAAFSTEKAAITLWPAANNGRVIINDIKYTVHALERMQPKWSILQGSQSYARGIPPSVVENAIKYGKISSGNTSATVARTFDNIEVITNSTGTRVITVKKITSK